MKSRFLSDNCGLWAPRLISATVVYILSTYKLIFIAALDSFKVNTKVWIGNIKYGTFNDKIFTLPHYLPQFPKFCIKDISFSLNTLSSPHRSTCSTKWIENVGTRNPVAGSESSKNVGFSHIWHSAKFWDFFLQLLKLSTSIQYTTWVLIVACQKQLSGLNLSGHGFGEPVKTFGPPAYFCSSWS